MITLTLGTFSSELNEDLEWNGNDKDFDGLLNTISESQREEWTPSMGSPISFVVNRVVEILGEKNVKIVDTNDYRVSKTVIL